MGGRLLTGAGHRYLEMLSYARRVTRQRDEAEDLLQSALLIAVEAGRADLNDSKNRHWLKGVLRNRAAFEARTAARRRAREQAAQITPLAQDTPAPNITAFTATLPRALRTTALLALTGHTKSEIAWLLNLPDTALRQRFAQIRLRWRKSGGGEIAGHPGLQGNMAFGRIRQALRRSLDQKADLLASHDPDGHLFTISSQNPGARQPRRATP